MAARSRCRADRGCSCAAARWRRARRRRRSTRRSARAADRPHSRIELVAAAVEPLEFDEQLARAVLGSRWRLRPSRALHTTTAPRPAHQVQPASCRTAVRVARTGRWPLGTLAQQRAARARDWRRISCCRGSLLAPDAAQRRLQPAAAVAAAPASAGSGSEWRRMNCLTSRSSSEWKLMATSRPRGREQLRAPAPGARSICRARR